MSIQRRNDPRLGEGILSRAALIGVLGGGVLGAAVNVPDVLDSLRATEPGVATVGDPSWLLVGAVVGGLIGLLSALTAGAVWLATARRFDGHRPRQRVVSALAAGVPVVLLAAASHWLTLIFVVPAVLVAYLAEPWIAYRPARGRVPASELDRVPAA